MHSQTQKHDSEKPCRFSLTVKTLEPEDAEKGRSYAVDFRKSRHNHAPSINKAGIRCLPPKLRREAFHMTNTLQMSLPDTVKSVKYLEEKYTIAVNPRSVRQMLSYGRSISNLKYLCTELFETLVALYEE